MNIIGIIRLAKGQVGYYDEKTNIHLTLSNPVAQVYDIMNTENLKKSIRYKTIELVSGSLISVFKLLFDTISEFTSISSSSLISSHSDDGVNCVITLPSLL